MADADAYEIQKKVYAGITPERELEMRLNAEVMAWEHKSKIKFPQTYIIGGEDGGGSGLEALIQAAMAKQLGVKVNNKTK